jgi:Bacterial Ig-like domain/LVIVD repeat
MKNIVRIATFLMVVLMVCSVGTQGDAQNPGLPNNPQIKGAFLSGPWASQGGRTSVVAFHQGYLITQYEGPGSKPGSDGKARYFDISDPASPVETIFNAGWNNAISAHGYWQEGRAIRGFGDWTFDGGAIRQITNEAEAGGAYFHTWSAGYGTVYPWPGRGLVYQPWHMSQYWSYADTTHPAALFKGDQFLAEFNPVTETGVIGHPFLLGNLLIYVSDQSHTGIAIYDITPSLQAPGTKPRLVGLYQDPLNSAQPGVSVGGYWPEIWGGGGRLKLLFPDQGNGIHIVDITDPSDMRLQKSWKWPPKQLWWQTPDPTYAQFQDIYGFTDRFKVNMVTLEIEELFEPTTYGVTVSQFSLPIGNILATGGYYNSFVGPDSQGLALWAHQAEPDVIAPYVAYHVPMNGTVNYHVAAPISLLIHETLRTETIVNGTNFTVRPVSALNELGSPIAGRIVFSFNDTLTFTPYPPLQQNTTYEVTVVAGGIKDAVGNGINGYSFRFSTGTTLVLPPIPQPLPNPEIPVDVPGGDTGPIPTPQPTDPPDNVSDVDQLAFTVRLNKRTNLPQSVVITLPEEVRASLRARRVRAKTRKKRGKKLQRIQGTTEVFINETLVKRHKLVDRSVVVVSLPEKRVRLAHQLQQQNTVTVRVIVGPGLTVRSGIRAY